MTQKEEIKKELIERIYKKLVHAMMGPDGKLLIKGGSSGSTDFLNGLIMAYRIVQSFDPKPESKVEEVVEKMKKSG